MPRGLIVKTGRWNRQPSEYRVVLLRNQRLGEDHGQWQPISVMGYIVLCPNLHEAREMVRYCGPRAGFSSPSGVIDDAYEKWVLGRYLRIEHYGRPKGRNEMLYAEFTRGWVPGPDLLTSRRSSPGITDGVIEPQYEHVQPSVVASAISASMGF